MALKLNCFPIFSQYSEEPPTQAENKIPQISGSASACLSAEQKPENIVGIQNRLLEHKLRR